MDSSELLRHHITDHALIKKAKKCGVTLLVKAFKIKAEENIFFNGNRNQS